MASLLTDRFKAGRHMSYSLGGPPSNSDYKG